jgi:hypothetical protein
MLPVSSDTAQNVCASEFPKNINRWEYQSTFTGPHFNFLNLLNTLIVKKRWIIPVFPLLVVAAKVKLRVP